MGFCSKVNIIYHVIIHLLHRTQVSCAYFLKHSQNLNGDTIINTSIYMVRLKFAFTSFYIIINISQF